MPTYQYICTGCANELEAVQSFSDGPLTTCPACSGQLRKVFGAVGVVFKGSGFYRTDSRTSTTAEAGAADKEPALAGADGKNGQQGEGKDSAQTATKAAGKASPGKENGSSAAKSTSSNKNPVAA